jgi:hypothetical protein
MSLSIDVRYRGLIKNSCHVQKLTFCCCSSHSQHEDFHGHRSLAILLSIDVRDDGCVVRKVCWLCHVCNACDSRVVVVVKIKRRCLITPRKVDRFEPVDSTMFRVKSSMVLSCGHAIAESLITMSCIASNSVHTAHRVEQCTESPGDLPLPRLIHGRPAPSQSRQCQAPLTTPLWSRRILHLVGT